MNRTPALNAMTVDVEDWFQVQAFADVMPRDAWDSQESRVVANTERILALFLQAGVRATFFTLGWVAERHPGLVRRIVMAGHELASHGYGHQPVSTLDPEAFREDIRRARHILQDIAGVAITGYRAPTFSISRKSTPWAHRILAEEGYRYSSSVFPGRHAARGDSVAGVEPWWADGVLEIPMTVLQSPLGNLPLAGGGWFRVTPYVAFRAALRRVNATGRRGVFYAHPWEMDPDQPKVSAATRMAKFRHYTGIADMERRVTALLEQFTWGRMDEVFAAELALRPASGDVGPLHLAAE